MKKLVATCPYGARMFKDNETKEESYSFADGLILSKPFGTRQEMVKDRCEILCGRKQRDICGILNYQHTFDFITNK